MTDDARPTDPTPAVLYEVLATGVALLTLNRPERLNAWNGALARDYFASIDRAVADPEVKVIVITGAGKGYCAGADMAELQGIGGGSAGGGLAEAVGQRVLGEMMSIPKPVIAAVNGAAAGMGLAQALLCDIRFASTTAKLTTSFGQRGLIAEWGLSWLLPRIVGTGRAMDLLLSGRVVLGDEAAAMGLVNAAVEPERLLEHTLAYAAGLAANVSPTSMAVMKRQVNDDWAKDFATADADAARLMVASLRRADFKEGVRSYVEKRTPAFPPVDPTA